MILYLNHKKLLNAKHYMALLLIILFYGCTEESKSTQRQYSITPPSNSLSVDESKPGLVKLIFINPQEDFVGRGLVEIEVKILNPPQDAKLGFFYVREAALEEQKKDIEQATGEAIFENLDIEETLVEWDQTSLEPDLYYVFAEVSSKKSIDRFVLDAAFEVKD